MSRRALLFLFFASAVVAQSPPFQCFGFNSANDGFDWEMQIPIANPLRIPFTAAMTTTVDQISVFESTGWNASISVAVHAINPSTGFPVLPALSTAPGGPYFSPYGWQAKTLTPPLSMVSGVTYVVIFSAAPTLTNFASSFGPVVAGSILLSQQATSTLMPYAGGSPNPLSPGVGGFKFSFNGPACGFRLAELRPGGPPCGGGTSWQPLLYTVTDMFAATGGRPLIGLPLTFGVSVGPGVPANLPIVMYWSVGTNLAGTPLGPTSPCSHWLDPVSLASLAAAGAEPLGTSVMIGGSPTFIVPIPLMPALVGATVAVQAVIVDPAGVPSGVPGLNIRLTNSLTLFLGY